MAPLLHDILAAGGSPRGSLDRTTLLVTGTLEVGCHAAQSNHDEGLILIMFPLADLLSGSS